MESHPEKDDKERKKEVEGIILLKNDLLKQGLKRQELSFFNVHIATQSNRRSYWFSMDHVVEDHKEMEKRIIELETRAKPYDTYLTETMLPIKMQDVLKEKYQSEFIILDFKKECSEYIARNCEWVAIAKERNSSNPPFRVR